MTALAKESPTSEDAFKPVEQMINEAFEEIDKATGVPVAMPVMDVSTAKHLVAECEVKLEAAGRACEGSDRRRSS